MTPITRGQYIVLINNDLVLTDGWLERMIRHAESDQAIGIVGPRSNYVSGPQLIPGLEFANFSQMHAHAARLALDEAGQGLEFPRVVGFCMVIRRAVIDRIGGFDEAFGLGNFEDDDLCLRTLIAGYRCLIANDTYVHHFGSRTFAGEQIDYGRSMEAAWAVFKEKWGLDMELELGGDFEIMQQPFEPEVHSFDLPNPAIVPVRGAGAPTEQAERFNSWGERLYSLGKLEEAGAFFHRALEVSADCANALNNLGVVAVDQKDVASAAGFLERSVENDQDNLNTLWNLIALYVHLGRDRAALPLLQNYLRLDPGNAAGEALLGELVAVTSTEAPPLPQPIVS